MIDFVIPTLQKRHFLHLSLLYIKYVSDMMQRNTQTHDHYAGVCSPCARSDKQLINTHTQNYGGSSALYSLCPSLPGYRQRKQFKAISGLITTLI